MSRFRTIVGTSLLLLFAAAESSRATPFDEFVTALARQDSIAMREVVLRHRDEMAKDFFLLLEEAYSLLGRAQLPEERHKARVFLLAAAQLAATFDQVYPRENLLSRRIAGSSMLTPAARSAAASDAALARFLATGAIALANPSSTVAPGLQVDVFSLALAAVAPPPGPPPLPDEDRQRKLAEEKKQRELRELFKRIEGLRRAGQVAGLVTVAADSSLPLPGRHRALTVLGDIGSSEAALGMVPLLEDDSVRDEAARALARVRPAAFPDLLRQAGQPGLTRQRAALALAAAGFRPRSPEEQARLHLVRNERLGLLLQGPLALSVLTAAARGGDPDTAATACAVLGLETILLLVALTLLTLRLKRLWIWPGARVEVSPGGKARLARVLPAHWRSAEPGRILYMAWGRDVLGRRRRIKVEVLASLAAASRGEPAGTAFDLVVTAGASVRPGAYVAAAPGGGVKIRVRRPL